MHIVSCKECSMTKDAIFCPACQRKNAADAESCIYCGAPLAAYSGGIRTTEKMSRTRPTASEAIPPPKHSLPKLPEGTFALFVMDDPEPVIVQRQEVVYLGRFGQIAPPSTVDLYRFKADELGVSRTHARISYNDGIYRIEDLASTTGTWLNQVRLVYGKSYELHNGDTILLGGMHIFLCLPEETTRGVVTFEARRVPSPDTVDLRILTPRFLESAVSQLIHAIVEVYSIYQASRGSPDESVHILSIRADAESPTIQITLDNGGEAIHLVRKWLVPWQRAHAGKDRPRQLADNEKVARELNRIAEDILLDVNPGLDEELQESLINKLLPPLTSLAFSDLELTPLE